MKKRLAIFFKILLILFVFAFLAVVTAAGVIWARWPLWVCAFILVGILGVVLGGFFFYKLLLRKKEQKFVSQIIEQDNAALKKKTQKEQALSKEMQEKWRAAMDSLKKSHLKTQGNPLYVLPWYLIIGKSGSGKTTAIKSANLSSSFSEVRSVSGISGTRNCDWWFFEQAILIDTAGRYAVPVDEDKDRDEWQKFLSLLAKYRKKEPLNGLIVTVPADYIYNAQTEDIEGYGRDIRSRVDELMRVLQAKFPVYVMVTKCDLVQGMTQFCQGLEDEALGQAMGMVNPWCRAGDKKDAVAFLSDGFRSMGERIRDLRLLMLQTRASGSPELMLFPGELEKLNQGLTSFAAALFQENPYQETPFFRGMFFSSGRQEGTPFSHFLRDMGLIGEAQVLPGTSRGLFLHDFFTRLLPKDRGLITRTMRGTAWARLTRNIGLAAWATIILAACGVLSFSFVKNLQIIKAASVPFSDQALLQGEMLADISTLEQFRTIINNIEAGNQNWWIPRLGLHDSLHVEAQLKAKFCNLVEKRFIAPADKLMADQMARFSTATPVTQLVFCIEHLVRRIGLIRERLSQKDLADSRIEQIRQMKPPGFDTMAMGAGIDIAQEIEVKLNRIYLDYLIWHQDAVALNQKMNDLQKWLARIISLEGATLNWLVDMANQDPELSPFTLAYFWGNPGVPDPGSSNPAMDASGDSQPSAMDEADRVAGAFTLKGKAAIDQFIQEVENALTDPLIIAGLKRRFYTGYHQSYLDTWIRFIKNFETGLDRLQGRQQWQALSQKAGLKTGPYFSLLTLFPDQVNPVTDQGQAPAWVILADQLNDLMAQAQALRVQKKGGTGVLGKAAQKVRARLGAPAAAGRIPPMDAAGLLAAAKSFMAFEDAMAELVPGVASSRAAFDLSTRMYTQDPATGDSPFFTAQRALKKIKSQVQVTDENALAVFSLLNGPLNFYHEFSLRQAACELQKKWEHDVLMEMNDVSDDGNVNTLLLGPEGFVTKFVKGPCSPFIRRGLKKGFYPVKLDNRSINLNPYFYKFLTRGVNVSKPVKSSYSVQISGLPTSSNDDAMVQPHATRLELVCAGETTRLENLNYPIQKVFAWSPGSECDVSFSIDIGSLELQKKYTGRLSFPRFLNDFSSGQHRFVPGDFPDFETELARMNVKYIRARYQFKNHEAAARLLTATPGKLPMEIAGCWE